VTAMRRYRAQILDLIQPIEKKYKICVIHGHFFDLVSGTRVMRGNSLTKTIRNAMSEAPGIDNTIISWKCHPIPLSNCRFTKTMITVSVIWKSHRISKEAHCSTKGVHYYPSKHDEEIIQAQLPTLVQETSYIHSAKYFESTNASQAVSVYTNRARTTKVEMAYKK